MVTVMVMVMVMVMVTVLVMVIMMVTVLVMVMVFAMAAVIVVMVVVVESLFLIANFSVCTQSHISVASEATTEDGRRQRRAGETGEQATVKSIRRRKRRRAGSREGHEEGGRPTNVVMSQTVRSDQWQRRAGSPG
jgi:hypothetical protein